MKIHFLTYGDNNFYIAKKHLINLAKKSDLFDNFISMGPKDLDYEFQKKYSSILSENRGGGFWIWKHRIINNLLTDIKENDLIVYCDAGASINLMPKAIYRFKEYVEIIASSKYGNLRMECEKHFIEKYYSTSELFNYFQLENDSLIGNSTQLQAGHMIFKKNKHTDDYFLEYEKLVNERADLITDQYNLNNQIEGFIENRHDQSIFSILSKIYGAEIIENETEFRTRPEEQYDFPFLSVRTYGHGIRDYIDFLLLNKSRMNQTVYFKH